MASGVLPGSRVATYRVLRELGARAQRTFAAVRGPHELVVIHRFSREGRSGVEGAQSLPADRLALVLRDAQCLAKNWHPNVARVKYVDLADGDLTIATELVDGATLADLSSIVTARGASFPLDVFVRVLLDVLAGVHAFHGLRDGMNRPIGAVHGALCPANIVVGRDGVARVINVLRPRPLLVAAGSEGVGYAAPEMLEGGAVDARADVYAAGVLLWEALTGRRLHDETDPARVLARQREIDIAHPELPAGSPYAMLSEVAMQALSFDPALRFRTANDMAAQLRRLPPKLIASGSVVAARVMELDGERIRGRRAALDPSASGSHRRPSSGSIEAATAAAARDPRKPTPKLVPPVPTVDRVTVVPVSSSALVEERSSGVHASAREASELAPPTVRRSPPIEPAPPTVRRPPPVPARPSSPEIASAQAPRPSPPRVAAAPSSPAIPAAPALEPTSAPRVVAAPSSPALPTAPEPAPAPPLGAAPSSLAIAAAASTSGLSDDAGSLEARPSPAPALRVEAPSSPSFAEPPLRNVSSPSLESAQHLRVATPASSPLLVEPPVTLAGSGPLPAIEPAPVERRSRRLLLAVAALLVLGCALFAVVLGVRAVARTAPLATTPSGAPPAVTTVASGPAATVDRPKPSSETAPAVEPPPASPSEGEPAEPAPSAPQEAAPARPEASSAPSPAPKRRYDPLGI